MLVSGAPRGRFLTMTAPPAHPLDCRRIRPCSLLRFFYKICKFPSPDLYYLVGRLNYTTARNLLVKVRDRETGGGGEGMSVHRTLGKIGNDRGKENEETTLAALQEGMPHWLFTVRIATAQEDAGGIDIVADSDVGPLYLQVKSSRRGVLEHRQKSRRKLIGVIRCNAGDSIEKRRVVALSILGQLRSDLQSLRRSN